MQPVTSQNLEQVRLSLDDALVAAQASGELSVVGAILTANSELARATIDATNREMALQAEAAAAGMTVIPNYSTPLESREILKNRLKSAEKKLDDSQKSQKDLMDQLGSLHTELSEHKNELFISGGTFWFRRFHSSLAIASAAAFLAIGSKIFDVNTSKEALQASVYPLGLFGLSLICSGCVPAAFAFKKEQIGWALSIVAATAFTAAILSCVIGAVNVGGLVWPKL